MKYRYTKFTGDELDELDLEDLLSKLSDLLLSSGFERPVRRRSDDEERPMQALHDAILDALLNGGVLPDETLEQLLGEAGGRRRRGAAQLEELIQQIIERLEQQGYITTPPDLEAEREPRARARAAGGARTAAGHVRGHRQEPRLPRLPRAARPARLARQEQLRPPRHARAWRPASRRAARRSRTSSATR